MKSFDVVIVGAGVVGASLACLLAQQGLHIALIENQAPHLLWPIERYDVRVSAINHASEKLFHQIGVWEKMKALRVSTYQHMVVWDSTSEGRIEFDSNEVSRENLGHIIENTVMLKALHEKIQEENHIEWICPTTAEKIIKMKEHIILELKDCSLQTKLLIGADGAKSWVREQLEIKFKEKSYPHVALVATVKTEKPHRHTAWQCFMPNGPLALLPLADEYYCSIVWSTLPSHAKQLNAMKEAEFNQTISQVFAKYLGDIEKVDKFIEFPLYERHVLNYIQDRVALVGDAAHTLHPLAGQGVNLGLQDAACLAKVIQGAREKQKDWGQDFILRCYERTRKSENWNMLVLTKGLQQLFGQSAGWISQLRSIGLNTINKTALIKRQFIQYALGD